MKVYVLYETYYGELQEEQGCGSRIMGVYKTLEQATEQAIGNMANDLYDNSWVLEKENEDIDNGKIWLLHYINDYNNYYTTIIECVEVE